MIKDRSSRGIPVIPELLRLAAPSLAPSGFAAHAAGSRLDKEVIINTRVNQACAS